MLLLAVGPTYSPLSNDRYARRRVGLTGWISVDLEISSAQGHATSGQAKHGSAAGKALRRSHCTETSRLIGGRLEQNVRDAFRSLRFGSSGGHFRH